MFKPTAGTHGFPSSRRCRNCAIRAGHPISGAQRAERVHERLLGGWMDLRAFTTRTGLGEGALLAAGTLFRT